MSKGFVRYDQEVRDCNDEYDFYSKYRSGIDESELKNSEASDKAVLTISSVAIGLLFNYGKSSAGTENETLLVIGWFLIATSMGFVILSMYFSGWLLGKNRKRVDLILSDRVEIIKRLYKYEEIAETNNFKIKEVKIEKVDFIHSKKVNIWTKLFHYGAPVLLLIGIVSIGFHFKATLKNTNKAEGQEQSKTNDIRFNSVNINTFKESCNGRTRPENTNTTTTTTTEEARETK